MIACLRNTRSDSTNPFYLSAKKCSVVAASVVLLKSALSGGNSTKQQRKEKAERNETRVDHVRGCSVVLTAAHCRSLFCVCGCFSLRLPSSPGERRKEKKKRRHPTERTGGSRRTPHCSLV